MNLHQFRFVQEAARRNLNLTEAAKALHTSQPGVSRQVRELEEELGVELRTASGPTLERGGDLAAILSGLGDREVLFVDEIHRMSRTVEEILYPAMEDFEVDVVLGSGPGAQSVKLPLQRFTLIGATTRSGMITAPLRARFGIHCTFDFYKPEELEQIKARGIKDERALAALLKVPRERFVPSGVAPQAYADRPLPIGYGQTISQPFIVAYMTEALQVTLDNAGRGIVRIDDKGVVILYNRRFLELLELPEALLALLHRSQVIWVSALALLALYGIDS